MGKRITRNAIQCKLCSDIIESTHRHDFVSCSCKAAFVDGGLDYLRRGGNPDDIIPLYESEETDETDDEEEECLKDLYTLKMNQD